MEVQGERPRWQQVPTTLARAVKAREPWTLRVPQLRRLATRKWRSARSAALLVSGSSG